jgi:FG-GAP repeat protein
MNTKPWVLLAVAGACAWLGDASAVTGVGAAPTTIVPETLRTTDYAASSSSVAPAAPLPWPEQKVTASDGQSNDQFGLHAVVDGKSALVSAPLAPGGTWQGVVYAFDNVGGAWQETQQLTASDAAPNNQFGGFLALAGDTAVIGAPEYPGITGGADERLGAAYVFTRAGGQWIETQKLTASDAIALDQFGGVLAFDGTTVMLSSNNNEEGDIGAVYVFTKASGIWTEQQKIVALGDAPPGAFGGAIAVAGDTAFVASLDYNTDVATGWVYVLKRDASGLWTQTQVIESPNVAGDYFGDSLAFNGTTLLIGAPGTTIGDNVWQGAVHVYAASQDGTWTPRQQLSANDGTDHDIFGFVAMHGHRAVVGAENADDVVGAAYVFAESGGVWSQVQKLAPSDGVSNDYFAPGQIGISDSAAVVGAWGAAPDGNPFQGAAYFYSNDAIFAGGFDAP